MAKDEKTFYEVLSEVIRDTEVDEQKKESIRQEPLLYDETINSIGRKTGMFNKINQERPDDLMNEHAKELMKFYDSDIDDLDERELELYL